MTNIYSIKSEIESKKTFSKNSSEIVPQHFEISVLNTTRIIRMKNQQTDKLSIQPSAIHRLLSKTRTNQTLANPIRNKYARKR